MFTPKTATALLVLVAYGCALLAPLRAQAQACDGRGLIVAGLAEDGVCAGGLGNENAETSVNDCIDHSTHNTAYYAQAVTCPRGDVQTPNSITEAQRMIRQAVSQGRRIKVVGHNHSNTDIICADGGQTIIETWRLTGIGSVTTFEGVPTIRVEPGVGSLLQEAAHAAGYSIEMNAPGFGEITVIGGLATGLHGGSPSSIAVRSRAASSRLKLMAPNGTITQYTRGTTGNGTAAQREQWRALLTHLGLLGFVTAVRVETRRNSVLTLSSQIRLRTKLQTPVSLSRAATMRSPTGFPSPTA